MRSCQVWRKRSESQSCPPPLPPPPPLARVQARRAFLISVSQVKSRRVLRCHAVGLSEGGSFGVGDQREQSKRFTPRCGRDRHLARKGRENKPTGNAQGARRGGVRQTPRNPPTLEGINQFIQPSNPSTPPLPPSTAAFHPPRLFPASVDLIGRLHAQPSNETPAMKCVHECSAGNG